MHPAGMFRCMVCWCMNVFPCLCICVCLSMHASGNMRILTHTNARGHTHRHTHQHTRVQTFTTHTRPRALISTANDALVMQQVNVGAVCCWKLLNWGQRLEHFFPHNVQGAIRRRERDMQVREVDASRWLVHTAEAERPTPAAYVLTSPDTVRPRARVKGDPGHMALGGGVIQRGRLHLGAAFPHGPALPLCGGGGPEIVPARDADARPGRAFSPSARTGAARERPASIAAHHCGTAQNEIPSAPEENVEIGDLKKLEGVMGVGLGLPLQPWGEGCNKAPPRMQCKFLFPKNIAGNNSS